MAWEGGWTPARTPLAYQAEMGALWERPAQELALAKAPPQPLGGPLSLVSRVSALDHICPQCSPASFARGMGIPRDWLVLAVPGLGLWTPIFILIVVGLGSLVGREA